MNDWWQILAVLAIAAGAVWLWLRTRRSHTCCDPDHPDSCNNHAHNDNCANCPLANHCHPQ
ncbi:MAG: hypothetical protein ACI4AM_01045 [Muribaculaceae bacterium]